MSCNASCSGSCYVYCQGCAGACSGTCLGSSIGITKGVSGVVKNNKNVDILSRFLSDLKESMDELCTCINVENLEGAKNLAYEIKGKLNTFSDIIQATCVDKKEED